MMKKNKQLTNNSLEDKIQLDRLARKAHDHTIHNTTEILRNSQVCGCCYCERIFDASEICKEDIITELSGEPTVWCPYCGIDAVFGDGCGVTPTPKLLKRMYKLFFE